MRMRLASIPLETLPTKAYQRPTGAATSPYQRLAEAYQPLPA